MALSKEFLDLVVAVGGPRLRPDPALEAEIDRFNRTLYGLTDMICLDRANTVAEDIFYRLGRYDVAELETIIAAERARGAS